MPHQGSQPERGMQMQVMLAEYSVTVSPDSAWVCQGLYIYLKAETYLIPYTANINKRRCVCDSAGEGEAPVIYRSPRRRG